jgi:hypothetical protein
MSHPGASRMIRCRAAAARIAAAIGCHTFRATGITAYFTNGGALQHHGDLDDLRPRRNTAGIQRSAADTYGPRRQIADIRTATRITPRV